MVTKEEVAKAKAVYDAARRTRYADYTDYAANGAAIEGAALHKYIKLKEEFENNKLNNIKHEETKK